MHNYYKLFKMSDQNLAMAKQNLLRTDKFNKHKKYFQLCTYMYMYSRFPPEQKLHYYSRYLPKTNILYVVVRHPT